MENRETLILKAAKSGNINQVCSLIADGAEINTSDQYGTTALMFAVIWAIQKWRDSLVDAGANVNLARKTYGLTALMLAASNQQLDIIQLLLSRGADVNAVNEDGSTALMIAALKGYLEIVKTLLDAGAEAGIVDKHGDTALKIAIKQGHTEVVQAILQNRINLDFGLDFVEPEGETPLILAGDLGHLAIVQALLAAGANVNIQTEDGTTAE